MTNDMKIKCKNCGKALPINHEGPCPDCGKKSKANDITIKASIGMVASASWQKTHEYVKQHIKWAIMSGLVAVISIVIGQIFAGLIGLLAAIIANILNWWITPRIRQIIVEITSGNTREGKQRDLKEAQNTDQDPQYTGQDIIRKLENLENKIDSSSRQQKLMAFCAIGAAVANIRDWFLARIYNKLGTISTGFL